MKYCTSIVLEVVILAVDGGVPALPFLPFPGVSTGSDVACLLVRGFAGVARSGRSAVGRRLDGGCFRPARDGGVRGAGLVPAVGTTLCAGWWGELWSLRRTKAFPRWRFYLSLLLPYILLVYLSASREITERCLLLAAIVAECPRMPSNALVVYN